MTQDNINKLIEKLEYWNCERPDEWTMNEFERLAKTIKLEIEDTDKLVEYKTEQLERLNENYDTLLAQHESFVEAYKSLWEVYANAQKNSL